MITAGGALFGTLGADVSCNNQTSQYCTYQMRGYVGGTLQVDLAISNLAASGCQTFEEILLFTSRFDEVRLSFSSATSSINLDNIVLTDVPEPATLGLLGLRLLGIGLVRRRRHS